MKLANDNSHDPADVKQLIAHIIVDAATDDEQLRAFHCALQDGTDNQGARILIDDVLAKSLWEDGCQDG